jgi:DNA primase
MIDKASEEQLKNSIDIVNIVSNYIEVKKAGTNFKANCPFHEEKTPSFIISPTKGLFHCFGCGVSGDAIKFVMDYEKLSYPEALEKIASIINFTLVYTKGSNNVNQIHRVLKEVQHWYVRNLSTALYANAYLKKRGININSIEKFGIGYAGKSNQLLKFLSDNLLPLDKAIEAGIIAQHNGQNSFYARLVERITFPIHSPNGVIVGFGGRTISNHPAKYINSPKTKLFNKSQLLYGYSIAKSSIYKKKEIIICEGYLDVILFHQAGFNTAVATLGTALTTQHFPLLRRGEPQIILAYDGDRAGVDAAFKASLILSEYGFNGSVVLFPDGTDPADMITEGKVQEVANLLCSGQEIIPFSIDMIANKYNLNAPHEKEKAFNEIKTFLKKLTPIIRDNYIPYSASILEISPALFRLGEQRVEKTFINLRQENLSILNIIKSVSQNSELLSELLNRVKPMEFKEYSSLLNIVIQGDINHPNLLELILNDNYKALDREQFQRELTNLIIILYREKYKSIIEDKEISYNEKQYILRKIKTDIIPRLKQGELLAFERFNSSIKDI